MKHLSKSLIALLLFAANTCAYAGQNRRMAQIAGYFFVLDVQ